VIQVRLGAAFIRESLALADLRELHDARLLLDGALKALSSAAIAEAIMRMGKKRLPLLPSAHTLRMMAKAAAAVYETAAETDAQDSAAM
jgi:hypothetical protein